MLLMLASPMTTDESAPAGVELRGGLSSAFRLSPLSVSMSIINSMEVPS
jgi:hypothetical protein